MFQQGLAAGPAAVPLPTHDNTVVFMSPEAVARSGAAADGDGDAAQAVAQSSQATTEAKAEPLAAATGEPAHAAAEASAAAQAQDRGAEAPQGVEATQHAVGPPQQRWEPHLQGPEAAGATAAQTTRPATVRARAWLLGLPQRLAVAVLQAVWGLLVWVALLVMGLMAAPLGLVLGGLYKRNRWAWEGEAPLKAPTECGDMPHACSACICTTCTLCVLLVRIIAPAGGGCGLASYLFPRTHCVAPPLSTFFACLPPSTHHTGA